MSVTPSDEYPHRPNDDPNWVEAWLFDVVHADASVAMSIELLLWPQRKRVAFHASVVRHDAALISLVELDAVAPKGRSLEVRSPGLWTEVGIQTPLDHVTVDIEAFAVELDDPMDVFRGGYGIRTALGSELEWEAAGAVAPGPSPDSYELPCVVHGELLIDEQTIEIDGWGWRSHRWGTPHIGDRTVTRGRTSDGHWLHEHGAQSDQTMVIVAEAPVPDSSLDAALHQSLMRGAAGDVAWVRRVEPY